MSWFEAADALELEAAAHTGDWASWARGPEPTGIRDQLPAPLGSGRDYGAGLWAQQWLALGRIMQRLRAAQGGRTANPAL